MSAVLITCPACSRKIECDHTLAGQQIQCPLCQQVVTAPRFTKPASSKIDSSDKKKLIIGALVLAILAPIGIYFGRDWQAKFNEKAEEAAKNSDGGQIGHIGALYQTLDQTEPTRLQTLPAGSSRFDDDDLSERPGSSFRRRRDPRPMSDLPVVAPEWNLDLDAAAIPVSQVNGAVSGNGFVADVIRFTRSPYGYVLSLRHGTNAIAEGEIQVVLRLKPSEPVESGAWSITPDLRTAPQVIKKWKTGPRMVAQKAFSNGYAMKLEFGEIEEGIIPGKIYLALPDAEQTVIAGEFEAVTHLVGAKERAGGRF